MGSLGAQDERAGIGAILANSHQPVPVVALLSETLSEEVQGFRAHAHTIDIELTQETIKRDAADLPVALHDSRGV